MSDYLTDTDSDAEISELRGEPEPDEVEMKERATRNGGSLYLRVNFPSARFHHEVFL